jgi:hypothetical protein
MTPKTYDATSTYVGTIDAPREEAYAILIGLDPMRTLATRLAALGIDDRAMWAESRDALGLVGTDGRREVLFSLVWRFGEAGMHAKLTWRIRLDDDNWGGTAMTVTIRARGSDAEASERVRGSWPVVETLALEHAKGLRRAVERNAEEAYETDAPRLRLAV